jgi:hypothetical protein
MAINTKAYLGLGKRTAQNKAEGENLIFRLVRVDQETILGYPEDFRDDRLCVEIDNEKVTKAVLH